MCYCFYQSSLVSFFLFENDRSIRTPFLPISILFTLIFRSENFYPKQRHLTNHKKFRDFIENNSFRLGSQTLFANSEKKQNIDFAGEDVPLLERNVPLLDTTAVPKTSIDQGNLAINCCIPSPQNNADLQGYCPHHNRKFPCPFHLIITEQYCSKREMVTKFL